MTGDPIRDLRRQLDRLPLTHLQSLVDPLSITDRMALASRLSDEIAHLAFICGYLSRRSDVGQDGGHRAAWDRGNRQRRDIRGVLGYHTTSPLPLP